jgi:predicted RNase H-like HicB family nuclease
MNYKGYKGVITKDESTGEYFGRVVECREVITSLGKTYLEAERELKVSIDDYLEWRTRGRG